MECFVLLIPSMTESFAGLPEKENVPDAAKHSHQDPLPDAVESHDDLSSASSSAGDPATTACAWRSRTTWLALRNRRDRNPTRFPTSALSPSRSLAIGSPATHHPWRSRLLACPRGTALICPAAVHRGAPAWHRTVLRGPSTASGILPTAPHPASADTPQHNQQFIQ